MHLMHLQVGASCVVVCMGYDAYGTLIAETETTYEVLVVHSEPKSSSGIPKTSPVNLSTPWADARAIVFPKSISLIAPIS